jgi:hypothetical protein
VPSVGALRAPETAADRAEDAASVRALMSRLEERGWDAEQ